MEETVKESTIFKEEMTKVFVDGEVLDVDELVEGPVGEDADGFVAVVVGGDHEMKFVFVTILQLPERRSFFVGEGRLE